MKDFHPENMIVGKSYQLTYIGVMDKQIHEEVGVYVGCKIKDKQYHIYFDMDCGIRVWFSWGQLIQATQATPV